MAPKKKQPIQEPTPVQAPVTRTVTGTPTGRRAADETTDYFVGFKNQTSGRFIPVALLCTTGLL